MFYLFFSGHRLKGEIRGSQTYCAFKDYYISVGLWFHFIIHWYNNAKYFGVYINGNWWNNRGCWKNTQENGENTVYTLGADESLAGNNNRDLDVSYDDLVIWYGIPPHHERIAPYSVAEGMVLIVMIVLVIMVRMIVTVIMVVVVLMLTVVAVIVMMSGDDVGYSNGGDEW
jgi:hypothetical protein